MRRRGLRSAKLQITNRKLQIRQRGYMLITLMLAFAMIAIALLAVLPEIGQQIRRDREEELRHRGTAYMRAIQHFYKKFGRYPSRVEELENTNNVRFLRKRYTDPMSIDRATGKEREFKFLHPQDIPLNSGIALGQIPGLSGQPGQGGSLNAATLSNALQQTGALGGLGAQAGAQQTNLNEPNPASGDSGNSSSGNASDAEENPNSPGSSSSSSSSGFNGPTFGGGPILGVASTSKKKTIRVFYTKDHYNDWLFIYVPQADRGGLLTGPVNPGMQTGNLGGLTPGQTAGGAPGQGGFGQGLGQGLTLGGGQTQGFQTQTPQTPAPTPQQ